MELLVLVTMIRPGPARIGRKSPLALEAFTNTTVETKQEMVDVLDEHGQHIYVDDPEETELPYEIRYLTTQGAITTRHNAVYYAALLSCTLMG